MRTRHFGITWHRPRHRRARLHHVAHVARERRRARALCAFHLLFCKAWAYARQIPALSTYHCVPGLLYMHVSLLRSRCGARTMYHLFQRCPKWLMGTRRRCQRRASSALVAETVVRTFGVIDVLGRVPSGSREGRVPSACITFFGSCTYLKWKPPNTFYAFVRFAPGIR